MIEVAYEPVVGDQAELKSGGPKMTVVRFTKYAVGPPVVNAEVECWWFDNCDDTNTLKKAAFPPAALDFDDPKDTDEPATFNEPTKLNEQNKFDSPTKKYPEEE